jgi:hypothetical protein
MNRSTLFALSVLVTISASTVAQEQKPASADPAKVERAEPKLGNTWTYAMLDPFSRAQTSEFVVTTASIDDTQIKNEVKNSSGTSGSSITDRDGGRIIADTQRTYTPPKQTYSFPLEVGKKWEYSTTFPYPACGTSRIDIKAEVVGWETVTVPAGTYRALRVDHSGYWNNCYGSDKHTEKYWYVPSLKVAVKVETVWGTKGGTGGNAYELKSAKVE